MHHSPSSTVLHGSVWLFLCGPLCREKLWNVPSQPYSLFLGLAGTVCFIADLCCIGDATNKETVDRIVSFPGCGL